VDTYTLLKCRLVAFFKPLKPLMSQRSRRGDKHHYGAKEPPARRRRTARSEASNTYWNYTRTTRGGQMTAEQVLQLHSEGFNRALIQQDYDALEGIYSEIYAGSA
jgi:hypothetical protein